MEFFCAPQWEKINFEKTGSTASAYSQNRPTASVNSVSWRLMAEDRTNAGGASTILEGSVKVATRFSINRRAWRKFWTVQNFRHARRFIAIDMAIWR